MKTLNLKADKRSVFGKQVKKLRRTGIIPANIFGKDIKSIAIQVEDKAFRMIARQAGTTHVIYISVDGKELPVLIQDLQHHPLTDTVLHVDFKNVDLKEKVEAEVPVELVGENALVKSGEADALLLADAVVVEALPTKIPERFTIDIATLTEIGAQIMVKDLPKSADYTFVDEEDKMIAQLAEAKKEEAVVQASPSPESVEATEEGPKEKEEEEAGEKKPAAEEKKEKGEK
ncbi:MAG: 50S ribosomal protein L25 [Patescibacteria group bacterium]